MKSLQKKKKIIPLSKHKIKTTYLDKIYDVRLYTKMIPALVKAIRSYRKKNHFDAIAFRGSSGAGVAYTLSYLLKIPLIHVRKQKGNNSHYYGDIEGTLSAYKYIIVDDFIISGDTIEVIKEKINKTFVDVGVKSLSNVSPELVAIFLYKEKYRYKKYGKIPVHYVRSK